MAVAGFQTLPQFVHLSRYGLGLPWTFSFPRPEPSVFDGRHVAFLSPLVYITEPSETRDQELLTVPTGYVIDGASVPTLLGLTYVLACTPMGEAVPAAAVHDLMCDQARKLWDEGRKEEARKRRAYADVLFREMVGHLPETNRRQRWLLANGVWIWGKVRY